ncbi:chromosomal replication initiator protein DnaA [Flammeovirgaceae bacterium SG7u.111]|nr:chromosomal replication initiator protein DnaA [Flammeovirgaceae bacterium SG7u.132]WPO33063.1 chromosomal replication initiator protein DnaA [Flammeovirgaceae bacterium SG7u.111]
MLKNCQAVWRNCLEIIKSEIQEQSFTTWFAPVKPIKLEGKILTIEVPTPFFYEWLEEHYVYLLKKAITHELGPDAKLEYSVVVDQGGAYNEPIRVKLKGENKQHPSAPATRQTREPSINKPAPKSNAKFLNSPFDLPHLEPEVVDSQLNPSYTFDTFIEGDCNRLARSAGMAIANKPGYTAFNPLVIYGGVGLGKTHLAQAIGNEIKRSHPEKVVLYVTTDQFTTQFIDSLRNNNVQNFTNFYLQVDVLIIDDIQFLSKKEKTQENFFHIFNRLHQSNKQIIMTSDKPPRSLEGLQERLLSRFKWGLTADVQTPDYETRVAIVKTKMDFEGVDVPEDVVDFLAQSVDSNIRELEGVLISLIANASLMRKDIDLDLAKSTLIHLVTSSEKEITVEFIQQLISDYFKVSIDELKSKTRKKDIATARQVAMYFSQQYTNQPLKVIGDRFGGRDHSTVVHASKTVKQKSSSDAIYGKMIKDITEQMEGKA